MATTTFYEVGTNGSSEIVFEGTVAAGGTATIDVSSSGFSLVNGPVIVGVFNQTALKPESATISGSTLTVPGTSGDRIAVILRRRGVL